MSLLQSGKSNSEIISDPSAEDIKIKPLRLESGNHQKHFCFKAKDVGSYFKDHVLSWIPLNLSIIKASRSQRPDNTCLRKCFIWEAIYKRILSGFFTDDFCLFVSSLSQELNTCTFHICQKWQFCAKTWNQESTVIPLVSLQYLCCGALKPEEPVGPARWQRAEQHLERRQQITPVTPQKGVSLDIYCIP